MYATGACQGVIALNMEDGTLHRFHAANTILATGVYTGVTEVCCSILRSVMLKPLPKSESCARVMAELISLQLQLIHALEMVMPWLLVLAYLCRLV